MPNTENDPVQTIGQKISGGILLSLPVELQLKMFSYLSLYDILQNCSLVCKFFYGLVKHENNYFSIRIKEYEDLRSNWFAQQRDDSFPKPSEPLEWIKHLCQMAGSFIHILDCSYIKEISDNYLDTIFPYLNHLEDLNLSGCVHISSLGLEKVFGKRKRERKLEIIPHLKKINLSDLNSVNDSHYHLLLNDDFNSNSNLEEICFNNCPSLILGINKDTLMKQPFYKLRKIELRKVKFVNLDPIFHLLTNCTQLIHLDFSYSELVHRSCSKISKPFMSTNIKCQNKMTIRLSNCSWISQEILSLKNPALAIIWGFFLSHKYNLSLLDLSGCSLDDMTFWSTYKFIKIYYGCDTRIRSGLFRSCDHLILDDNIALTDNGLEALSLLFRGTSLSHISFNYNDLIRDSGLVSFFSSCPVIKRSITHISVSSLMSLSWSWVRFVHDHLINARIIEMFDLTKMAISFSMLKTFSSGIYDSGTDPTFLDWTTSKTSSSLFIVKDMNDLDDCIVQNLLENYPERFIEYNQLKKNRIIYLICYQSQGSRHLCFSHIENTQNGRKECILWTEPKNCSFWKGKSMRVGLKINFENLDEHARDKSQIIFLNISNNIHIGFKLLLDESGVEYG